jgi:Txe/YoeB family toxin of Txe-Axe toxin-antitoxin module
MKDPRFETVKKLFEFGQIKSFKDIITHIPVSTLRQVIHTNHYRMTRIVNNPSELQYDEVAALAREIGVEHRVISEMIEREIKANRKKNAN